MRPRWPRPSPGKLAMMKNGHCVALTGGIACGKSTVAEFWRVQGAEILDADTVGHELLAPGGECVDAVLREFGPEMRSADNGVDRHRLGALVFADVRARARLNDLLHPAVIRRLRAWAEEIRRQGRLGVAVIPLLYEVGLEREWDAVVCVTSDEKTMLERLAGRGLTPAEARARIASQWPLREKIARADRVIENNGSLAELEQKSRVIWTDLFEKGD